MHRARKALRRGLEAPVDRQSSIRACQESALEKLTEREREVLGYTAEGYSSAEIGKKLFISPKTVDTYRSRIMEKLKLNHRSELVRFALNTGLLKPEKS